MTEIGASPPGENVPVEELRENAADLCQLRVEVGSLPFSIRPTRLLLAPAKPTSRSTASGGAVQMRSVGSALGFAFSVAAFRARRSLVARSALLTCSVVSTRVDRNASGAKSMNHWLKRSTEAAMSAFQRCGLHDAE